MKSAAVIVASPCMKTRCRWAMVDQAERSRALEDDDDEEEEDEGAFDDSVDAEADGEADDD